METNLASFTDILSDGILDSQPMSLSTTNNSTQRTQEYIVEPTRPISRPKKHTGQHGDFRSVEEIDPKYREVFTYPYFNLVQSRVIEDALYSDKSIVVCAPTGSGKTVIFEMAIVQLLMEIDEKKYDKDFKIIYMAPVKALCTERLAEWYSKFTKLGLLCIEVTGDTDVDVSHLKPYRVIITTPEKWDILTRRWRDHRGLVELIKLFLIDEVHILNDETRGPVLEAVVSRMKTIESSTQSEHRIEQLQRQHQGSQETNLTVSTPPPRIRFVAVSATVSNPEDVATWLGSSDKPAVYYKFGDECRPVKLKRVVEGYPCADGTSIFKFDIILNYKLWPIIQKYHDGKPTLIFCNTRKSVTLTAEALSREITISFNPEQRARLTALASTIKNKKLQALVLAGVGCHHAGLLFEERVNIENAFRNRDLPILITTTTLAMGVNLPAHLVIIKNTQQYVKGAYQEYSISTVLQMVGRAGRPQFDTEATAVIMTRMSDKPRYEALVCGSEPLQSYLHKRLPENLNSEAALGTVNDVAQCVQWLRSTFLYVRAARDPKRYLSLPNNAPGHLISKKIEELCVRAMNALATAGLISMDEASCIESKEAGRLMSIFYLDLETMKQIIKVEGSATLEQVLWVVCESHELSEVHLRMDERRCLNALNRNNAAPTIRFPMKGKISTRQMKLNCVIQAVLGCLPIPDASLNQEAMKIMRSADRICKCLVAYVTRPDLISGQPNFFSAVLNSLILAKCIAAHLWENSPYLSKQLKGIGPTFSTLLATAGKINFMLLEESHPRDLERIMNKGPPAGNVLRKQISLLPKYQVTMTPVDEKVVTVQLSLLNHMSLAENMENLTAGDRHKFHIIVGDSENYLLLLKSFQDKDLIGMYDGTITLEIKRKHNFEHKILVHCVSSQFVGIDAQCEYVFKDLDPAPTHVDVNSFYFNKDLPANKTKHKQSFITDVYKERKRKLNCDLEISQSKEKKKRETALAEKIRILKESFGKASKEAKEEFQRTTDKSNKIVHEILRIDENIPLDNADKNPQEINKTTADNNELTKVNVNKSFEDVNYKDFETYDSIDDNKINDILNDIESEISKDVHNVNYSDSPNICNNITVHAYTKNSFENTSKKTTNVTKKPKKSNFNCLELLDKNVDFNEEEDYKRLNDTGFSDTIKSQINRYIQQTQLSSKTDILMDALIEGNNNAIIKDTVHNTVVDLSYGKNEYVLETGQNQSKIDDNLTDFVKTADKTEEAEDGIEKLDIKTTPSDMSVLPLNSHLTKTEDINKTYHLNTIKNNMHTFSYQNSKNGQNNTFQDTVYNYDKNVIIAPLETYKNGRNEHDSSLNSLDKDNFSNNINNKMATAEEKSRNNFLFTSKSVNNPVMASKFVVEQNRDDSNDININSKWNDTRNYSYSAINVDISTRHETDHHVHVIKKIKLDLDVTEIVTRYNLRQDANSDSATYADTCPPVPRVESSGICDSAHLSETTTNLTLKTQDNASAHNPISIYQNNAFIHSTRWKEITHNDELSNKENKNSNKLVYKPMTPLEEVENRIYSRKTDDSYPVQKFNEGNSVKGQAIIRDSETLVAEPTVTVRNPDIKDNGTESPECKEKQSSFSTNSSFNQLTTTLKTGLTFNKNEDINCPDTSPRLIAIYKQPEISETKDHKSHLKTTTQNENDNFKRNENKLENILQKYSQALRQIKKEDEKCKIKAPHVNNERQVNTSKNKRPFKITDIDKIEPKLPPLLATEVPVYSVLPQNKEVTEKNVLHQTPTTYEVTEVTNVECNEVISQEEIELTPMPAKDLVTTTDYKIDDSMLNPKMLLQCLIKDEPEIIPPPPEFSDLNYSPSQVVHNEKDSHYESIENPAFLDCYENVLNSPNHMYTDSREKYLRNTPNEIETILLSNNNNYDYYTETRPFAITQSSAFRGEPSNCYTARRAKLNNFKFMNKKKFKVNR